MQYTDPKPAKPLITLPETLIIGTGEAATQYTVYFQHEVTLRIEQASVTSDGDGVISVDFTDEALGAMQEFFRPGVTYLCWVTEAGDGLMDWVTITIDDTPVEMVSLTFEKATALETQTITLE